jgi:hypothetical protein
VVQQAFPHQEGVTGVIGGTSFPPSIGARRRLVAINQGYRYLLHVDKRWLATGESTDTLKGEVCVCSPYDNSRER